LWYISDFGFCGPANKPLRTIYGNLSYIAPEVINGKEHTYASDIYSIAMLMCEISSGQPPFANYDHDHNLAMKIIGGKRPIIAPNTPKEYKQLITQCWNADPTKRPKIKILWNKIREISKLYYENENQEMNTSYHLQVPIKNFIDPISRNIEKLYQRKNISKSRNVTEGIK